MAKNKLDDNFIRDVNNDLQSIYKDILLPPIGFSIIRNAITYPMTYYRKSVARNICNPADDDNSAIKMAAKNGHKETTCFLYDFLTNMPVDSNKKQQMLSSIHNSPEIMNIIQEGAKSRP